MSQVSSLIKCLLKALVFVISLWSLFKLFHIFHATVIKGALASSDSTMWNIEAVSISYVLVVNSNSS